ncbi:DoxX family protein [Tamlana nanhaiensis]|uniref:DoxX family protein n=1 Tax=Neotamlana nanhaiensis TaxID=1382798 RepID=A0A0D7VY38_9FLAO|nr:DoxX family membrane protein [Tamlana nanhaiensis]KJD31348.1 DoxX family protein [Tamlana nanhaiensis]
MKRIILNVLSALFGVMMINGGLNKFLNYMPTPENMSKALVKDFKALVEISWLLPLIGVAEIIGGLLIIIPKTRALGALILFPVMVGILLTNTIVEPNGFIMTLVLWIIFIWILLDNKKKYTPLF